MKRLVIGAVAAALASSAAAPAHAASRVRTVTGMSYVSNTVIPTGTWYQDHLVFGLSGIDYDAAANRFVSQRDNFAWNSGNGGHPVAFELQPVFSAGNAGYDLRLTGVNALGGAHGMSSLESIRYDPSGNGLWLAAEAPNRLYHVAADGSRTQVALPDAVTGRTPGGAGNYGLEGMSFSPDGSIWLSRENSMAGDAAGFVRLSQLSASGDLLSQYAYRLDDVIATNNGDRPIANPPGGGVGNNGVSEILAITDTSFLVMERAWDGIGATAAPTGVSHNYIRIHRVDLSDATDISGHADLVESGFTAASKTLLFDSRSLADVLNTYETKIDNLEGMSFGPRLRDGRVSLVLASDNNNSRAQGKTQFVVFGLDTNAVPEPGTWMLMIAGFGGIAAMQRRRPRAAAAAA